MSANILANRSLFLRNLLTLWVTHMPCLSNSTPFHGVSHLTGRYDLIQTPLLLRQIVSALQLHNLTPMSLCVHTLVVLPLWQQQSARPLSTPECRLFIQVGLLLLLFRGLHRRLLCLLFRHLYQLSRLIQSAVAAELHCRRFTLFCAGFCLGSTVVPFKQGMLLGAAASQWW